tara:strand:+ start:2460 stop:5609 length:3150 start_codon:yes stop_codon:yes gene_type:complete
MAAKKITENPKVTDTIIFDILTPGADDCFTSDPFKVDDVKIFHIQKNFTDTNDKQFEKVFWDGNLLEEAETARQLACDFPTDANILAAQVAKTRAEEESPSQIFYYSEARPVAIFGDDLNPAWLSTDTSNAFIEKVPLDADGNSQFGHFKLTWEPVGIREGDYFICYRWTPLPAGDKLYNNVIFFLNSDTAANTVIPSHQTTDGKYELLLDRYLPEMYQHSLLSSDLTSGTLDKLNRAVAKNFTTTEDLANQLIDLYNSNVVNESFLVFLSNMFDLKLRSGDPTLWRKQIKTAVPLFKKKGTLQGLKDALTQSGMVMNKHTPLWQIISPYTWQESFEVVGGVETFELARVAILPTNANFSLSLLAVGETTFLNLPTDNVTFTTTNGVTTITWVGDQKSTNPITLINGDILLVKYVYKTVPDATQQTIEDFILTLPLSDKRGIRDQKYPLKNWNVRLIEEDDPLFDILIPTKHPFADPIVFGQIRTEFPYSENIYNMEEYNGSIRDSFDPCNIGRTFLDPCRACLSSSVSLDIGLEEISDDRILEAREVIEEYSPFHMVVHSLNVGGEINEFISTPVEEIEMLVQINGAENVIAGNANAFFTRVREDGDDLNTITREMLTNSTVRVSGPSGTLYNSKVALYDPEVNFKDVGLSISSNLLEIKAPSPNAGAYTVLPLDKHFVEVPSGATEPLNKSSFTYSLMNDIYTNVATSVFQDDVFVFSDVGVNFNFLGTQTQKEGTSWEVLIPAYSATKYPIKDIISDGTILLNDITSTLPVVDTTGISYTLYTDTGTVVATSTAGVLNPERRGRVEITDTTLTDARGLLKIDDLVEISGTKYILLEFVEGETHKFYVKDYSSGDASGLTIVVYRLLLEDHIGYFDYQGITLETAIDHEFNLGILNGVNGETDPDEILETDQYKENFLILIDGTDYYKIEEIDGKTVTLGGPMKDVKTLGAGGTTALYAIHQFLKQEIIVDENYSSQDPRPHNFLFIDRRGQDMVEALRQSNPTDTVSFIALANDTGSNFQDAVSLEEGLSIKIEYKNGETEEGDII